MMTDVVVFMTTQVTLSADIHTCSYRRVGSVELRV